MPSPHTAAADRTPNAGLRISRSMPWLLSASPPVSALTALPWRWAPNARQNAPSTASNTANHIISGAAVGVVLLSFCPCGRWPRSSCRRQSSAPRGPAPGRSRRPRSTPRRAERELGEDEQRRADQQQRGPDLADPADRQVGVAAEVVERQGEQDGVRDEQRREVPPLDHAGDHERDGNRDQRQPVGDGIHDPAQVGHLVEPAGHVAVHPVGAAHDRQDKGGVAVLLRQGRARRTAGRRGTSPRSGRWGW